MRIYTVHNMSYTVLINNWIYNILYFVTPPNRNYNKLRWYSMRTQSRINSLRLYFQIDIGCYCCWIIKIRCTSRVFSEPTHLVFRPSVQALLKGYRIIIHSGLFFFFLSDHSFCNSSNNRATYKLALDH